MVKVAPPPPVTKLKAPPTVAIFTAHTFGAIGFRMLSNAVLTTMVGAFKANSVGVFNVGELRAVDVMAPAVTTPKVVKAVVAVRVPVTVVGPVRLTPVAPDKEMVGVVIEMEVDAKIEAVVELRVVDVPKMSMLIPLMVVLVQVAEPNFNSVVASIEVVARDEIETFPVIGTFEKRLMAP